MWRGLSQCNALRRSIADSHFGHTNGFSIYGDESQYCTILYSWYRTQTEVLYSMLYRTAWLFLFPVTDTSFVFSTFIPVLPTVPGKIKKLKIRPRCDGPVTSDYYAHHDYNIIIIIMLFSSFVFYCVLLHVL